MGLLGARFEVGGGRGELPPSEFCPTSGDWGELGILNLAQTPQTKCYWMLQNARVAALVS